MTNDVDLRNVPALLGKLKSACEDDAKRIAALVADLDARRESVNRRTKAQLDKRSTELKEVEDYIAALEAATNDPPSSPQSEAPANGGEVVLTVTGGGHAGRPLI